MKYKGTPISTGIGIGNLIFVDTKPVLVKTQKYLILNPSL